MNHLEALQRGDGRWDYTCHNNRTGTYPIGYCRPWQESTKEELIEKYGECTGTMFFNHQEKTRCFKDKHHSGGHETRKEAQECYKQYQLDQSVCKSKMLNQQQKCQICDAWTSETITIGGYVNFVLCPDHQGREHLEKLYEVGSSWES